MSQPPVENGDLSCRKLKVKKVNNLVRQAGRQLVRVSETGGQTVNMRHKKNAS